MKPTNKVTAGVLANGAMAIIVWLAKTYGKVDIPAEVAMGGMTLITFAIQWKVTDAE